ncbi:uncharacterized protein WM294_007574 isoform 1-T2 [Sarcoramphus papa]
MNARVQTQSPALTLALKQAAGAQQEGFSLRDSRRHRGKQGDGSSPDASEFRIRLIPTGPCRRLAMDCCCALPLGRCVRLNDVISGSCCSFPKCLHRVIEPGKKRSVWPELLLKHETQFMSSEAGGVTGVAVAKPCPKSPLMGRSWRWSNLRDCDNPGNNHSLEKAPWLSWGICHLPNKEDDTACPQT